ncbi:MAG TPA: ABC transporter permease [Gemmataceae bacterium]|nr:ABC transporter permease [Gemmataceae bacterium]
MDGMPGMGLETSLVETANRLLYILSGLVGLALVVGVFTLPLFYGTLAYKLAWFWASDVTSGNVFKRLGAAGLRLGLPLFSLVATAVSLGYFGAFDYPYRLAVGLPPNKMGPVQDAVKTRYDGLTRKFGEASSPVLPQDVTIDWRRCPDRARELIALWKAETGPMPDPLGPMFPGANPPEPPPGPASTPAAVVRRAAELIAAREDGSLYVNPSGEELTKAEIYEADGYFDRAVKETKLKQDTAVNRLRAFGLYVMLLFGPFPLLVFASSFVVGRHGAVLVLRSIVRALLRTSLTYLAVFVLVFILTSIWSVLDFLGMLTSQKDANMKGIVTEKFQIPSQMKPDHLNGIKREIEALPPDMRPEVIDDNLMTWTFVGGTLDPAKRTFQNSIFFFATEPEKVLKMMPGLEDLTGEELEMLRKGTEAMAKDPRAVIIGAEKLKQLNKRVGDRMKLTSLNYKDIEFDFTIIGSFPSGGRWENSAVMNRKYLDNELDAYKGRTGKEHPLAEKCMNLIWVRLPNPKAFDLLSDRLADKGKFSPAIKMEIESSAYANFLSPYKTLIGFMRYVLAPGLLIITTLVASLVIGIGVRERKTEIAVLKVLGFRPRAVLGLILGEALLVGALSGFMATATAYTMINAVGGIPLPIAFFGKFFIPENGLWWGPAIGGLTSLVGAVLPSFTAYRIKASQVFSRVT